MDKREIILDLLKGTPLEAAVDHVRAYVLSTTEKYADLAAKYVPMCTWGNLSKQVVLIYDNAFEYEELKAFHDFLKSDTGQKITKLMPILQNDVQNTANQWSVKIVNALHQELPKKAEAEIDEVLKRLDTTDAVNMQSVPSNKKQDTELVCESAD